MEGFENDLPNHRAMVRLSAIAKALDVPATDYLCYYDREADSVVKVAEYEHLPEEEGIRQEIAGDTSGRFTQILAEGNLGREAMREFAENIEDDGIRSVLEDALEWKGSRRFRDAVMEAEIEDMWDDFREHYFLAAAREWCEDHDVPARM